MAGKPPEVMVSTQRAVQFPGSSGNDQARLYNRPLLVRLRVPNFPANLIGKQTSTNLHYEGYNLTVDQSPLVEPHLVPRMADRPASGSR